jgi:hypothetical protein
MNSDRCNQCAIRRTPNAGFSFLTATMASWTAGGRFVFRTLAERPPGLTANPASPCFRYRFTHCRIVSGDNPVSATISFNGIRSSSCNRTTFRRRSREYGLGGGVGLRGRPPFFTWRAVML